MSRKLHILLALLLCPAALRLEAENWPQWRGGLGNGISSEKSVPLSWGPRENILWKTPLPGLGSSSPVIWGEKIFLTSQIGDGPFEGRGRDFEEAVAARKSGDRDQVVFVVQAFHKKDGRLLWEHKIPAVGALPPVHAKHNLASPSCVTDGNRLYAWMGTGQLAALDLDGKLLWERHLGKEFGPFDVLWGHGSSPLLFGDLLILLCDHPPASYILALDAKSGQERWRLDRGTERRSYSTPIVVETAQGPEMIINSNRGLEAMDPKTGRQLWVIPEENRVPVGMPVLAEDGMIYTNRGYSSSPYLAVRPGGRGDVTASHVTWKVATGGPYVSSLLYYDGLVYMATENGIVSCIDAADGKTVWKERLGGVFTASPVAAAGHIFFINEDGETFVVKPGREPVVVHRNRLEERSVASPAVSGGRIFIRTDHHLVCIG